MRRKPIETSKFVACCTSPMSSRFFSQLSSCEMETPPVETPTHPSGIVFLGLNLYMGGSSLFSNRTLKSQIRGRLPKKMPLYVKLGPKSLPIGFLFFRSRRFNLLNHRNHGLT